MLHTCDSKKLLYCNSGLYSDVLNSIPSYFVLSASSLNYFSIYSSIYWRYLKSKEKNKKIDNQAKNQNNSSIPDPNLRILRSVFVISFIIIFGWIVGSAARNSVTTLCNTITTTFSNIFKDEKGNPSQTISNIITTYLLSIVICINPISAGINSLILFTSKNAFKKAFGIKQQSNAVVPIGPYFKNQQT
ncbi:unnamed protein product [Meloidogyne enterolobii]|uniref:Uncharacterized protein n=1 Tax=Meloidogyne enterolobii TaxID=390850 RepID=A0ACB0YJT5_MELEN